MRSSEVYGEVRKCALEAGASVRMTLCCAVSPWLTRPAQVAAKGVLMVSGGVRSYRPRRVSANPV